MPHDKPIRIKGRITDVFAHRFIVETEASQRILADIGPRAAETFALETGRSVVIEGERKPSEIKVERIMYEGADDWTKAHKAHHDHHPPHAHPPHAHPEADPAEAMKAVKTAGLEPLGTPRRKPKHFEVLARRHDKELVECHVTLEGHIRKEKPVSPHDEKWAGALAGSA